MQAAIQYLNYQKKCKRLVEQHCFQSHRTDRGFWVSLKSYAPPPPFHIVCVCVCVWLCQQYYKAKLISITTLQEYRR